MKKILILGPIPATAGIGGVTVHVQRLLQFLSNTNPDIYDFIDYKRTKFIIILNKIRKYRYIHLHMSNPYVRLLISLCACILGTKTIITFHGNYCNLKYLKKIVLLVTLKLSHIPIVINQSSYDYCIKYNPKTILLPAFIPPIKEQPIDKDVLDMLNGIHTSGRLLVSTNASSLAYDENDNEIYGIGFLINFFSKKPNVTLIISDPTGLNKKKYGTKCSNIIFLDFPHNYYEILKRTDLFIRNTSTDGDALSIKESLYVGCRTICSDAVVRPTGCILFHYNDANSLNKALELAIKKDNEPIQIENGAFRLKELYNQLLS